MAAASVRVISIMNGKYFNAEEARAHLILVRDGLSTVDYVFEKTKFIPNRYIGRYRRISIIEDLRQIAYTAHIAAIQSFPVNSDMNFFGWASQTIRREVVDYIKYSKRVSSASDGLKKSGVSILGTCEHPEDSYLLNERDRQLAAALRSIGKKNSRAITESFLDGGSPTHNDTSYFKRRKRLSQSLNELKRFRMLREYLYD